MKSLSRNLIITHFFNLISKSSQSLSIFDSNFKTVKCEKNRGAYPILFKIPEIQYSMTLQKLLLYNLWQKSLNFFSFIKISSDAIDFSKKIPLKNSHVAGALP